MKKWSILLLLLCSILAGNAQICIGNSTQATAALFDPNWIYGCATGTSCSGGVQFTNLVACEPITTMDMCAPAPTGCGSGANGSDLWFSFYAIASTATINVIQNTSLVAAIQAFSGSNDCATLVQIGCNVAGGPSSGVQLVLNGLLPGELYYFRVYGSANNASQRTGLYCFCGSTGLSNTPLPVNLHLEATGSGAKGLLEWSVSDGAAIDHYEIERGQTVTELHRVATLAADLLSATTAYGWQDDQAPVGNNYYRIKGIDGNGHSKYSNIAVALIEADSKFHLVGNPVHDILKVQTGSAFIGNILNLQGSVVATQAFSQGDNQMNVQHLPAGLYLFKNVESGATCRLVVQH